MVSLDRDLSTQVARMVGDSDELDKVARKIEAVAKTEAAKHSKTGDFEASIRMEKVPGKNGVTDREVFSDDPAASDIEMGHLTPDHTWVSGLHILRNAGLRVSGKG